MRITALLAALLTLAGPASAATTYLFRNVTPSATTNSSSPPLQSNDPATGITVTVPCVSCRVRSGSAISFQPASSGTQGAVSWSLSSGTLPPGASLNAATGALTGTAGAPGTSSFALAVTDDRAQPVSSQTVGFQIIPPPSVAYAGSSGTSGRSLNMGPSATGLLGPSTYAVTSGALPSGLTLDTSTGTIAGTVNQTAVSIVVTVTDSDGASAASAPFDIVNTDKGAISFASSSYSGRTGVSLSVAPVLTAMKGGATLSVSSGVIPAGMTLNTTSGTISGTPTIAGTNANIVLQGPDANNTTVKSSPITITVVKPSIAYAPTTAYIGQPYSLLPTVTALNNPTFSKVGGSMPPGLALQPSTGAIAGTPTTQGTYSGNLITGVDSDLAQGYSNVFAIQVVPALSASFPALTLGRVGQAFTATATSSNFASAPVWSLTAGSLPSGISLATASGQMSGTPTVAGDSTNIVLTATQGSNTASTQPFTLRIVPPLDLSYPGAVTIPRAQPANIQAKVVGTMGTPSFTLAAGSLPTGLSVSASTGAITGTPTVSGTSSGLQGRVTDTGASSLSNTFAITVADQTASMASATARVGNFFSQAATSTLITSPSWALSAGTLPAGLTVQSSGVVEGTPRASGTYSALQMRATGTDGSATTPSFQVRVLDALALSPPPAVSGQVGNALSASAPAVSGSYGSLTFGLTKGGADVTNSLGATCPGLSFNAATGAISGTPTAACSTSLAYTVADDGNGDQALAANATSSAFTLTVTPAAATSTTSSVTVVEGSPVVFSATTTLANATWSVTGNPAWMTFAVSGSSYGTNSVSADVTSQVTYTVVLTATNGSGSTSTTVTVTVDPAKETVANALTRSGGSFSAPASQTMVAAGTWSVTATPADVSGLAVSNGNLTGTAPANTGTSPISRTLTASYTAITPPSVGPAATVSASPTLTVYPTLSIGNPTDQSGTVGTAMSFAAPAVIGKFGGLTYALLQGTNDVSGTLGSICPGLTFNASTGAVSGNPTAACAPRLSYKVTDDGTGVTALAATATSLPFNLTVAGATVTPSTTSVSLTEGDTATFSATTSLPNPTWTATGNPAWMTFTASGGTYSTSSVSADVGIATSYSVVLKATSGSSSAQQSVSVTVNPSTVTVATPTPVRSGGAFTAALTKTMAAAGTWSATATPSDVTGLGITGSTLSGTAPANNGTAAVTRTLVATHAATTAPSSGNRATASGSATLTVYPGLSIAAPVDQGGTAGTGMSFAAPAVTGKVGTLTYALLQGSTDISSTLGTLCPGLGFSASTGAVSGTPTAACTATLAYRVNDNGNGTASLAATATSTTFNLTVAPASGGASQTSVTVTEGSPTTFSGTTGLQNATWTATGNPAWMTFTASGGTYSTSSVSADVTSTQSYSVVLTARTAAGASTSSTVAVTVQPATASVAAVAVRPGAAFSTPVGTSMVAAGGWTATADQSDVTDLAVDGGTLTGTAPINFGATPMTRTLNVAYTAATPPSSGAAATATASNTLTVHPAFSIAGPPNRTGNAGVALSFAAPAVTGKVGTLTYAMYQGTTDVSNTFGAVCAGLTFNTATGAVSGTPTGSCLSVLSYRVSDDGGGNPDLAASARSTTFQLNVAPATVTASTTSATVMEGDTVAFSATTSLPTPTWSVTGNPAWMTFTTTGGTYATSGVSADVATATTYSVVLKATSGASTAQQTVTVTVNPAAATLASAAVRTAKPFTAAVTETMAAAGTWSAAASPADVTGLTVSGSTLSGTAPANAGTTAITRALTATYTATAAPSSGASAAAVATSTLTVHPALSIAAQTAKTGYSGSPLPFAAPAVTGQVGTLTYAMFQGTTDVSASLGSVCAGLSFSTSTGAVSGTPTGACSASLSYKVTDDGAGNAALAASATNAPFSLTVTTATVTASTTSVTVTEGDTVSVSATTTLPSPNWSVTGNPAWMTFTNSGGTYATSSVSADVTAQATYTVTLTATSGSTSAQQAVTVTVNPSSVTLATPATVRGGGSFSAAVTKTMVAAGTWTASSSPADVTGLAVGGSTLTGTAPANAGTTAITRILSAAYTANGTPTAGTKATASGSATLTVYPGLSIAAPANQGTTAGTNLTFNAPLVSGQAGALTYTLLQGSTDVSSTLGNLCQGMSFAKATGVVSGVPSSACSLTLAYRVADDGGSNPALAASATSSTFTLTVVPATATASTASVSVMEGDTVSFSATSSLSNPTWSATGNPAWMTFSANGATYSTSSVSGDVTASTTYTVTLTATNGSGTNTAVTVPVTVAPASATLAAGTVRSGGTFGLALSESMTAAGAWTATSSPADVTGLSVSGSTLSGTAPANATTANVTRALTATYTASTPPSSGATAAAVASSTLTVYPQLSVASIPNQFGATPTPVSVAAPAVYGRSGTLSWSLLSGGNDITSSFGSLCPGLYFSPSAGTITGVPTGSCVVTMAHRVSDDGGGVGSMAATATSATPFTLDVAAVSITPSAPTVQSGATLSMSASTSLGTPTWSVSGNPAWMTWSPSGSNFVTSATVPDVASATTFPVTVQATSNGRTASATASVTVQPQPALLPFPINVRSGATFSVALPPAFANNSWTVTSDQNDVANLRIAGATLSGTAPAVTVTSGTHANRYLTATSPGQDNRTTWLYIYPKLSIDISAMTTSGYLNQAYSNHGLPRAVGLIGNATWATSSKIPAGLTFNPKTGYFTGTPTEFGSWPITMTVTDDFDGAVATTNFALVIGSGYDIQFYRHEDSASYLWDFGNPGTGSGALYQYVTIRNISQKDVQLLSVSATGDANDVDAFQMQTGPVDCGQYCQVPGTNTWAHSYAPYGTSSVGSASASDQGSSFDCQSVLRVGYYCKMLVRVSGSSPGVKNGSISVTTQNMTTTIPATHVSSGWIPGGSAIFTQPGTYQPFLGAARQITTRFFMIGGGNAGSNNSSRGGYSGMAVYGDTISDPNGKLSVAVGAGSTTYQALNNSSYNTTSYIGPLNSPVYNNKVLYNGVYAQSGTAGSGFAAGGGYAASSGYASYDGQNGYTGPVYNGMTYSTLNGVSDPRYAFPQSGNPTNGYKNASVSYAPGGAGHAGYTACGTTVNDGVYGGTGGGGGVNIAVQGSPAAVASPATAGGPNAYSVQGGGGQGFGAGGGGGEMQSGKCVVSSSRYGPAGVGASGVVYIEWDPQ